MEDTLFTVLVLDLVNWKSGDTFHHLVRILLSVISKFVFASDNQVSH